MSDWIHAIILGVIEGLTEFIPVSSTGMLLLAKQAMGLPPGFWDTFCVLIQLGGLNLVTDPLWSERASPFSFAGPRRICLPGIAFDDLPRIDAVLLSHNHYDHLDKASLRRLVERDDPRILTPLGNDTIVRRAIPRARVETGDWWDGFALDDGVEATIVPAQHWSARGPRDQKQEI